MARLRCGRIMPSPFPGGDPCLESHGYWPDFHTRFMTYCCDGLSDVLPERYEARLGEQLRLIEVKDPEIRTVLSDVAILEGKAAWNGETAAVVIVPTVRFEMLESGLPKLL